MLLDKFKIRNNVVSHCNGSFCCCLWLRSFHRLRTLLRRSALCCTRIASIRWWRLRNRHRLTGFWTCCRQFLFDYPASANRATAGRPTNGKTFDKDPAHKWNWLATNQTSFIKQPLVLAMKFLITVVRENAGIGFIGNGENECIATSNSTSRWRHQFVVCNRSLKFRAFFLRDAVTKGGINDDRNLGSLELFHERLNGFV